MAIADDGGRRGRFKIRGVYYPTYRSVRAEIKRRLAAYPVGGPKDLAADDVDWFVHLIREMHPYASEKLARPVVGIKKYNRYGHQADNLMLVYDDGSALPFSWNKCCKGKTSSDALSAKAAFRAAVQDQTSAVMDAAFRDSAEAACPSCGKPVQRCDSHVDHMPPEFQDLLGAWLIDRDMTIDQVVLADDPQGGAILPAGPVRDSWRAFHAEQSRLWVICVPCHKAKHRT